jgi:hypothetical protein
MLYIYNTTETGITIFPGSETEIVNLRARTGFSWLIAGTSGELLEA